MLATIWHFVVCLLTYLHVWRGWGDVVDVCSCFGTTCRPGYGRAREWIFSEGGSTKFFLGGGRTRFLSTRHVGADFVSSHVVDKKIGAGL